MDKCKGRRFSPAAFWYNVSTMIEIENLPGFRFVEDFYAELEGPSKIVDVNDVYRAELIDRLEQVITLTPIEDLRISIYTSQYFIDRLAVKEYNSGDIVVEYFVNFDEEECKSLVLVRYDKEGHLKTYAFPRRLDDSHHETAVVDDEDYDFEGPICDALWNMQGWGMVFRGDGTVLNLNVCADKDKEYITVAVWERFWGCDSFWELGNYNIAMQLSQKEMIALVKSYIQYGSYAVLSKGKCTNLYLNSMPWDEGKEHFNIHNSLRGEYYKAKRKHDAALVGTFNILGLDYLKETWEGSRALAHSKRFGIMPALKKWRDEHYMDGRDSFALNLLLSIRGDRESMMKLSRLVKAPKASNYWKRKALGLPLSFEPIEKKPRTKRLKACDKYQMEFILC